MADVKKVIISDFCQMEKYSSSLRTKVRQNEWEKICISE